MKKVLFIIVFNLFSFCLFAQNITLKGRYVADLLKYNYNGWEISRGDTINYKNSGKVIVKKFRKQVYMETYIIYTIVQNENGDAIVFDLDEEINNGNIITPTGIKVRNGYENDNLRYTRDSAIKEWKLNILPLKDGKVNYTAIVEVPNTSKDELYNRAKLWFAKNFKDSKEVLQIDDKVNGKILGKGNSSVYWSYSAIAAPVEVSIWQLFDLSIKENRVRLIITDISCKFFTPSTKYTAGGYISTNIESWATKKNGKMVRQENTTKFFNSVNADIISTINSFESFLKNPTLSTNSKDDNW